MEPQKQQKVVAFKERLRNHQSCETGRIMGCNKRSNKELIGNSWSKEGKEKVSQCDQSLLHGQVCIGSSSMSRSSSSDIKDVQLQLRCLSASKSQSHPAKENNSVFSPPRRPMLAYCTAEFIASTAIKHARSLEAVSTAFLQNLKASLL